MSLPNCFEAILSPAGDNPVAVDRAHALFITASIIARKPERVLELGVGSAYLTQSILHALLFNQSGGVTCVDNLCDWQGKMPPYMEQLSRCGVQLVIADEKEFLAADSADSYDFIMSDANHFHAQEYVSDVFRIARNNAFIFFHDTSNPMFPNLQQITQFVQRSGFSHFEFKGKTRPDERTDRGLLFVIKDK